ncbi:uncharacterized protein C19orf47-like [Uloborus diversus]|uniref:uncharacterized protein C19orf47-like n=1 Tax=Uloborus diversus TaxID=327109 RepID=UPI002409F654|nr:uncharacterized protein C19orf47-like [Uloborus diversus]
MSQVFDTSQWITFFTRAGLPPNVAANYALIFSDNRIQLNMLMDLSKEYLYDMGIKIMGDVIAILRYAKEFHTQLAKERAIGITTSSLNKSAVAERMVGHYTRPSKASPNRLSLSRNDQIAERMVGHYTRPTPASPKRLLLSRNDQKIPKKSTVISLKRPAEDNPAPKKIRRVPPEEEGAYKIKMPLGITEKTRKLLKQQQQQSLGKKSVFARLGDSAVSSSTDTTTKSTSSVFERLGASNKNSDNVPTSTVLGETKKKKGAPLQYQGVLKMTTFGKTRTVSSSPQNKAPVSSRTVFKPGTGFRGITKTVNYNRINAILQSKDSVKNKNSLSSQGIFGSSLPVSQRLGVKSRLGNQLKQHLSKNNVVLKTKKNVSKNTSVFSRLGR